MRLTLSLVLLCLAPLFLRAGTADETRAAFLKIIDRPRVEPAVEVKNSELKDGIKIERFSYASDAKNRVPSILIKKEEGAEKRPVVIVLHGTSGTKESNVGLATDFAKSGFIGVALDGRYHGERSNEGKGDITYNEAIFRAYKDGGEHPFYWDTVWDIHRLIDVLVARPDVDAARIGIMGFSKGGIETFFTAASDPRIAAAAPLIGVQSFKWGLENDSWQARINTVGKAAKAAREADGLPFDVAFAKKFLDKLVPGIYGDFDCPVMLTLIAPRPLIIVNGDTDKNTPVVGLKLAVETATKAYAAAGAEDRFKFILQENTGHTVNKPELAEVKAWFVKWLKP